MKERLKSPVVWIEFIGIVAGLIIAFYPGATGTVKLISAGLVALISLFAGLNNPTSRDSF